MAPPPLISDRVTMFVCSETCFSGSSQGQLKCQLNATWRKRYLGSELGKRVLYLDITFSNIIYPMSRFRM